jgi:hypothetical protein
MAVRISRGPHIALGLAEITTPEQVRAAFLELTKQFHPARFGRMSSEVQKMSNEVFLGIKSAHDTMMRTLGAPTKPGRMVTGAIPAIAAEGSQAIRAVPQHGASRPPSGPIATQRPNAAGTTGPLPARPGSPSPARPGTPPQRAPTPALGVPLSRPGTPPQRPSSPAIALAAGAPRPAPVFDEQAGLEVAKALLARRDWTAAGQALQALANRVPQSKPYRALLYYAHGRIAQAAGKAEDAALEFQRALQLDADLREARTALAEVQRKR